jgi:hypothetical protein
VAGELMLSVGGAQVKDEAEARVEGQEEEDGLSHGEPWQSSYVILGVWIIVPTCI